MVDYGIKVMKAGYSITDTDIRNILMSSKYPMLKYHSDNTGSVTFNPGDTQHYIEITHGLGYVPSFISFYQANGKIYNINATGAQGVGGSIYGFSWADATKVRTGLAFSGSPYNQSTFTQIITNGANMYDSSLDSINIMEVGNNPLGGGINNGAARFTSVPISGNTIIVSATLTFKAAYKGTGQLKMRTKGIAEDNTNDFTVNPFTRPSTSNFTDNSLNIGTNNLVNIDVTSIVNEIKGRASWVSGNAMGFLMWDNGSDSGAYIEDVISGGAGSYITIIYQTPGSMVISFRVIIFKDKIA